MTTVQQQNTDKTLTDHIAEKELLYGNCPDLGTQACGGQAIDMKMDADSRVVCDLCDMEGDFVSLSNVSLHDAGSILINAFDDNVSPSMEPAEGLSPKPSVDSVSMLPLSPIPITRQISTSSFGSLDPLFDDFDMSVCPEVHEAELSEDDLFESLAVPSLGRSISSSWQTPSLSTPRSSFLMTSVARTTFGTTPSPAAVYTDENVDCNATTPASPYRLPSKNRRASLCGEHCAASTGFFKNSGLDDLNLNLLDLDFIDDCEGSPNPDSISTKCVLPPSKGLVSTRAPFRAKAFKPTPIKALPRPPPSLPSLVTATPVSTTTGCWHFPKIMSNFDVDGNLIPLTEEQAAKQRNWVNKRKRIKYGTKYVYTTKQNIARARKRKDGKFEPKKSKAIKAQIQKTPKGQRQSKRQRQ